MLYAPGRMCYNGQRAPVPALEETPDVHQAPGPGGRGAKKERTHVQMSTRAAALCLAAALLLGGCATQEAKTSSSTAEPQQSSTAPSQEEGQGQQGAPITFTDALGREVTIESWQRVVSLYGSFAETWVLAGGTLVGATVDATEERQLPLGDEVQVVGSVKEPDLEQILAAQPDLVILSADIAGQVALDEALETAQVPHAYYRVDAFEDYLQMLEQFCEMTGRDDLYEENGLKVREQIDRVLAATDGLEGPTVLLLRAYSTGAKAKADDNLAGVMLRDLGADNIAARYESLLEDVSMEEIIAADPDVILVTTMGTDTEKAMQYMAQTFEADPAWAGLTAVREGRYVQLPRELFHYKPNLRWGESYAYLAKILYPQLAGTLAEG